MDKNDFIGILIYTLITAFFGYKFAFLLLFIKENSDRCHYYNGKWNIKDLILYSVCITIVAAYFSIINLVVEINGFFLSCLKYIKTLCS